MHLTDFPDRLSPMLVKELRQGMRTRAFISVFLTLQIILAIILLSATAASTSENAGNTISSIIFSLFAFAVLVIQPLRGVGTLSSEIKSNTIDMMVMTRLSASRIVLGKWFAIVSQSALILVTIIPYIILRYFLGGMNLFGEIILLALIFITSAAATAITTGLSASSSVILRSILPMLAAPILGWTLLLMSFNRGFSTLINLCSLDSSSSTAFVTTFVFCCLYFGYFFLSIGTSLIAPLSENQSTTRRLVALAVTIIVTIIATTTSIIPSSSLILIYSLIFTPVFLTSLSEFSQFVPPLYAPFKKLGSPGKLAAIFLLPGSASGLFFCILITLIAAIAFALNPNSFNSDTKATLVISAVGSLLFPALLINLFRTAGPQRISNYLLFLIASIFLSSVLYGLSQSMSNPSFLWLFAWMPTIFYSMTGSYRIDNTAVLFVSIIVNSAIAFVLFLSAVNTYRKTLASLQTASPDHPPAPEA